MSGGAASVARLAAFAALAAFATAHWATLVETPPRGRLVLALAAILAGAVVLEAIGRARLGRLPAGLLAAACGLAATALALAAIGISPRLLWPPGWSELGASLDHGLAGLAGSVDYPYEGDNGWSRLAILAVAPLALGLAATLAFWPADGTGRRPLRLSGLAVLIAVYAAAVAANPPGDGLARGLLLLALVTACLWLPAIRRRDALVAAGLVALAGAIAVPAAAQLDASEPWLDYKSWKLRSADGTTYRWEHSYGPIDWPREGTQMLAVESRSAHYWKTVVLDRFDGRLWTRSTEGAGAARDISAATDDSVLPPRADPEWVKRINVTVGELESEVVVGAGTPIRVQGIGEVAAAPDGTTLSRDGPLEKGDAYSVTVYVPDPTAEELRAAPEGYPSALADYTRIELPGERGGEGAAGSAAALAVPLRGDAASDDPVARRLADSPYGEMHGLTRRLVDAQPTTYDAVRSIQDHLRGEYAYSEGPPARRYPLAAFLFEDRIGYCQQFSGAMALMLRMAGIPSRVAGGFAPGTREPGREVFRVEDFDAHSWVEAYFNEIGWVAFDPTPAAAPAASQQVPGFPTADVAQSRVGAASEQDHPADGGTAGPGVPGGSSGGGAPLLAVSVALLFGMALGVVVVGARTLRHRALSPAIAAEAQLAELAAALDRFGWRTSGGATLLAVEGRLRRSRRPAAARYIGRLRAVRYATAGGPPPSLADRRALRRELSSANGLGGRLSTLVAIPPGGPRLPRRV